MLYILHCFYFRVIRFSSFRQLLLQTETAGWRSESAWIEWAAALTSIKYGSRLSSDVGIPVKLSSTSLLSSPYLSE